MLKLDAAGSLPASNSTEVRAYLESSPAPVASDSNKKEAAAWPALLMTVPLLSLTVLNAALSG